jgi:hypothetical protein
MTNKKTCDALGKIEIFFRINYQNNNSKIHLHVKVISGKKDYKGLAVLFQSNPFPSMNCFMKIIYQIRNLMHH